MADKASPQILDFTGVKDQGAINPVHVEPGEYLMKVISVTEGTSKSDNAQWIFVLGFTDPPANARRATYGYYCVLDAKSLWKIRGLAIAAGIDVPKSKIKFDPARLVNRLVGVVLDDDEYEGRVRSKIVSVIPPSELDGAIQAETLGDDEPPVEHLTGDEDL